jgi:hypothetical protein
MWVKKPLRSSAWNAEKTKAESNLKCTLSIFCHLLRHPHATDVQKGELLEIAMENGKHSSSSLSSSERITPRLRKNAVLTETGRSPWYDANGIPQNAYVVGVAGGSASGKTSVAKAILNKLPKVPWVGIVSQDSFYKSLSRQQSKLAFENNYNFDHPNAFDHDLLKECIAECVSSVRVAYLDYESHSIFLTV